MISIHGKTAITTEGNSNIGTGIALKFSIEGGKCRIGCSYYFNRT